MIDHAKANIFQLCMPPSIIVDNYCEHFKWQAAIFGFGDDFISWQFALKLFANALGLIMNVILFYQFLHLRRNTYGIIILNQLLIGMVYCSLHVQVYLVFVIGRIWPNVPNISFFTWFETNVCISGSLSLVYVQQLALVLLCVDRLLATANEEWMKEWRTHKMYIVYCALCWLACLIQVNRLVYRIRMCKAINCSKVPFVRLRRRFTLRTRLRWLKLY